MVFERVVGVTFGSGAMILVGMGASRKDFFRMHMRD